MTAWPAAAGRDGRGLDAIFALLLFAAVVGYVAALPLSLGTPDEGHGLHAAKRIFEGEAIYRDIFDLTTPGWAYLLAGLYHVFGATLATARLTVAVIHGATAALMFIACRRLGVRRTLSWACGASYLVVCQQMFANASYHWLATFLSVALLVWCLRPRDSAAWAFGLGVVSGLMVAIHQQRGFGIGLGVAAFLAARGVIAYRYGIAPSGRSVVWQLVGFSAGVLLVVAVLFSALIAIAGVGPVWDSLIIFPLVNYRGAHTSPWGHDFAGASRFLLSHLLKYLPLVLLGSVAALWIPWSSRRDVERVQSRAALIVLCVFSIFSIIYFPDSVHIAFIAPLFLVAVADVVDWTLGYLPAPVNRGVGAVAAAAVVAASAAILYGKLVALRERYPVAYPSAFGRVDMLRGPQTQYWDQLRALVDADPSHYLYSYPIAGYTHLLSGARNPTRFALIVPGPYTPPPQVQEILDALASKRVPYVVGVPRLADATDPIAVFIREHYEPAQVAYPLSLSLWRRKDAPEGG